MKEQPIFYRKNFALFFFFFVIIIVSLVLALSLGYNLANKHIENEFASQKTDVLENTVAPYNDFLQNKLPEISFYQGYLDSVSILKYVNRVLNNYPFIEKIIFYDIEVSNRANINGLRINRLSMEPDAVYQFGRKIPKDSVILYKSGKTGNLPLKNVEEFNKMALKFTKFIELSDTTRAIQNTDLFSTFYNVTPNRISYMSVPRREDLRSFKMLMFNKGYEAAVYEQDMLTFYLNPTLLKINNIYPQLYEEISIVPMVYDQTDSEPMSLNTETPLPGAFSDYKLYFKSSSEYLQDEINRRFLPIAFSILLIYCVLFLITYLIYRNLQVNIRLFKLQYAFVNNLTHEFKTPLSVIKIAGNNICSANKLSHDELKHYGKILDEEADKLNDMMNRLLSFTQIETKSVRINAENVDLEVFCQNLIDAYQIKYPDFRISFRLRNVSHFKTDPILLGSIFQNLIDNAYKYAPADRKELDISIEKIKTNIIFRFTDRGIGIPKKEVDNIFKKFYRIQSQYNQQGSIGLGLAFCKELAELMKGNIFVKSKIDKGSEFKVTLPYEK